MIKNISICLYEACQKGFDLNVHFFLNKGFDVNLIDEKTGDSPLFVGSKYEQINTVQLLLKYDADINSNNKKGENPFHIACRNRHAIL